MSARSIAVLGGPGAGKSVWLAALFDWLDYGEQLPIGFDGSAADARELLRMRAPLAEGRFLDRTIVGTNTPLDVPLRVRSSGERLRLHVSDYAGEEVDRIFGDRTWSASWRDRSRAGGLLLFVRPEAYVPLPRLSAAATPSLTGLDPSRFFALLPEHAAEVPAPASTDAVRVPTVLALVELLQCLRAERDLAPGERPDRGQLRIAVMLSAWDAMPAAWRSAGPAHYLSQELCLLDDLLWAGFHPEDVRCFGLSAVGGDLNNASYRRRYLDEPGGFVEWNDAFGEIRTTRDVALPLYWMLFGEPAFDLTGGR